MMFKSNAAATTWCYKCKTEKTIKGGSKKNGLFVCIECKPKPKKVEDKPSFEKDDQKENNVNSHT